MIVIQPHQIKQVPIIPFGNEQRYRKKFTTFCGSYLITEKSKVYELKPHTKLPSKYKEPTISTRDISSSLVSTGVDLKFPSNANLTPYEWINMETCQKIRY